VEVGLADEAHVLLAASAGQPQGMGLGEAGERLRVAPGLRRSLEPLEVDVQRRSLVQLQHAVLRAAGDQHRLAQPAPSVPHADALAAAPRRSSDAPVAADVLTENPGPPSAVTTTLASPGPSVAISPAVEQPISGTSPARSPIASSRAGRS